MLTQCSHVCARSPEEEEPDYAAVYEPRKHQQRSRQQFLDACAEQVEQLLQIIKGAYTHSRQSDRLDRDQIVLLIDGVWDQRHQVAVTGKGAPVGTDEGRW